MAKTLKEKVVEVFTKKAVKEDVKVEAVKGFDAELPENKQREYR